MILKLAICWLVHIEGKIKMCSKDFLVRTNPSTVAFEIFWNVHVLAFGGDDQGKVPKSALFTVSLIFGHLRSKPISKIAPPERSIDCGSWDLRYDLFCLAWSEGLKFQEQRFGYLSNLPGLKSQKKKSPVWALRSEATLLVHVQHFRIF